MKNSKHFIEHYSALDKKFNKCYRELLHSNEAENIHQLRVSLKKVKAFFHLLNYLYGNFHFNKMFREFKKIFDEAGKVRDVEVQLILLDSIEKEINLPLVNQRMRLQKNKKAKFNYLRNILKRRSGFNKDVKSDIVKLLKRDFTFDKIKLYFIRESEELTGRLKKYNPQFKELHHLRIHLKRYYYNLVLLNNFMPKNKLITEHVDRLNKLQEQLGKLHDSVSMLGVTGKFKTGKDFSATEMKSIRLMNVRLAKANKKQALKIRKHFHPLVVNLEMIKEGLLKPGNKIDLEW